MEQNQQCDRRKEEDDGETESDQQRRSRLLRETLKSHGIYRCPHCGECGKKTETKRLLNIQSVSRRYKCCVSCLDVVRSQLQLACPLPCQCTIESVNERHILRHVTRDLDSLIGMIHEFKAMTRVKWQLGYFETMQELPTDEMDQWEKTGQSDKLIRMDSNLPLDEQLRLLALLMWNSFTMPASAHSAAAPYGYVFLPTRQFMHSWRTRLDERAARVESERSSFNEIYDHLERYKKLQ